MTNIYQRKGNAMLYDFLIEQGASLDINLTYQTSAGVSMISEGTSARMKIKDKIGGDVISSLTTENSGITLTPSTGAISIDISSTATAAMSGWEQAVYDLELESTAGVVKRLLRGTVTLSLQVTD